MKVVILAGGGGSRLFPLSRANFPKQFLKLSGEISLLAQTINRFLPLVNPADIIIVTNKNYLHHVKAEAASCGALAAHVLLEPVGRNTAPAIALAIKYCLEELDAADEETLIVTPSDHIISPSQPFLAAVNIAAGLVKHGKIVTFGIMPDKPETGYGYIEIGEPYLAGFTVTSFHEKPDRNTAEENLKTGNYYWNSGMFAFTIGHLRQEYQLYQPDLAEMLNLSFAEMIERFAETPNISLDYAVIEKSRQVVTVPLAAYWNDIGSWDAIYEVLNKDDSKNAIRGDCVAIDCRNTLLLGQKRLLAAIGVENLLVVETDDVILVAKKGDSQKVKELVAELKNRERREVHEHMTNYRPWGSYTLLEEGPGYRIKKIAVNPGQHFSLQLHYHRSEHWIVIGGTAKVTIGEVEQMVHENESVFVAPCTRHCLENPGRIPLEIIEVQNGKYLKEDDIVSFDDLYDRN